MSKIHGESVACLLTKGSVMAWEFFTDPEFQEKLDWVATFVREEIEPLDLLWPHDRYKALTDEQRVIVEPLKQQVRDMDLWACHLGPDLGGKGYGQLKLALLNEQLGRSGWAPRIFGTQAPDTATPRSSPTSARRSRRPSTSSRCSTERSSRATR